MGYTHYFTQTRNFTKTEWADVCEHIGDILKDVEHNQGVPLASWNGEAKTRPEITAELIAFNGLGDDSHESFVINRIRPPKEDWQSCRGSSFCKTAQKPYDLAVAACLSYLATVTETHRVSSDGDGAEWLAGVEEARRALPRFANILDIPMPIMQADRWCSPWISGSAKGFDINFCVDGKGYVQRTATGESYCFESHSAMAKFLDRTKRVEFPRGGGSGWSRYEAVESNIWNASGSFDRTRQERIKHAQARILKTLFPVDSSCAIQPPSHVRPGQMPPVEKRAYSFSDLLTLA